MNTLGKILRLTTFGESHGAAMGGVLDGLPAGTRIDMVSVMEMIQRRRTGVNPLTSQRKEEDCPEILSGISPEGIALGSPIGFIFRNKDHRSADYGELADHYRPNHADFTYDQRYGIRDYRGGGRASARETVNWVMGGALAKQWLEKLGITIEARLTGVGEVQYDSPLREIIEHPMDGNLPYDEKKEKKMLEEVDKARREMDSVGGRVSCVIRGVKAGVGTPVFGKVQARLAEAMLSLNAVKGFEYGIGAEAAEMRGSEMLDEFNEGFMPSPFKTDFAGGALGGITTGMPICFNLWFKPTPTISRPLGMATREGCVDSVEVHGRHDPCVAMRAPVIVESLAWLIIGDLLLLSGHNL